MTDVADMHANSTPVVAATSPLAVCTTTPPAPAHPSDASFGQFLDAAGTIEPTRHPVAGDLDGSGTLDEGERAIQKIRDMVKRLQEQLIMLVLQGDLTEAQRARLTTGMNALTKLANSAEADIRAGEQLDGKQLLETASKLMLTAMRTDPPTADEGRFDPATPESKRAWREQRARVDAAVGL